MSESGCSKWKWGFLDHGCNKWKWFSRSWFMMMKLRLSKYEGEGFSFEIKLSSCDYLRMWLQLEGQSNGLISLPQLCFASQLK